MVEPKGKLAAAIEGKIEVIRIKFGTDEMIVSMKRQGEERMKPPCKGVQI